MGPQESTSPYGTSDQIPQPDEHPLIDDPPPPFSMGNLLSHRMVTILVGSPQKKYTIHENLLSSKSEFFRAAFNSGFRESNDGVLEFPEEEHSAFDLFVGVSNFRT